MGKDGEEEGEVKGLAAMLLITAVALATWWGYRHDQREKYFRCMESPAEDRRQADLNCKEWYGQ